MKDLIFKNRKEAGQLLAQKLRKYQGSNAIVLGIPRGGVPVAYEIAEELGCKLDIILSKKIGHPMSPEFAIGSVTLTSIIIDCEEDISRNYLEEKVDEIRQALIKKNKLYRGNKPYPELKDKTVIIVDDGIATGNTLLVSIEMLRKLGVAKIVVACPVIPSDRVKIILKAADEFIYLYAPEDFTGVGAFYKEFNQVTDKEVIKILTTETVHKQN